MTQFGRALLALNIDIICANSPQAKGRVERVFGTLQDTRNLTLHYDRMMLILEPTPLTRGLVRKKVEA